MFTTLIVFQVLVAAGLIAIVLVQRGPGATMGAAFGAGASGTVFGSRGAGNFLTRTTGWLALGFFGISLTLAVLATGVATQGESESALTGSVVEEQADAETESGADAAIDTALQQLDEQSGGADAAAAPEEAPTPRDAPAPGTDAAGQQSNNPDGDAAEPPGAA